MRLPNGTPRIFSYLLSHGVFQTHFSQSCTRLVPLKDALRTELPRRGQHTYLASSLHLGMAFLWHSAADEAELHKMLRTEDSSTEMISNNFFLSSKSAFLLIGSI